MNKIELYSIVSGTIAQVNANFEILKEELNNKVLYRDNPDNTPNQMNDALDMAGNRILNIPAPINPTDPVRLVDLGSLGGAGETGPQGPQGIQGIKGDKGDTGAQGVPGSGGGGVVDVPFSTAIPLTYAGDAYMASKTVTGALTFTPAASAVRGALVYLRCVADGVNLPVYSSFKEWGGSMGYDNRNGIENQMQFFYDGFNYFVSISQAIGAVPIPASASNVTLTGPTSGVVGQASTVYTLGVSPVGGSITGTVVVTPSDSGAGGTFNPSTVSLSNGTTSSTFTYTASSTGAKTISVTNNGGLTNPSSITYTAVAAATAPAQMTAPVATAAPQSAAITLTAPSNGGSAITSYAVTSSPAGGVDSGAGTTSLSRTVTGLTAGVAYTFTATATNGIGTSSPSPASNSVTAGAAPTATNMRLSQLTNVAESGTNPYTYTANTSTYSTSANGPGGVALTHFDVGADGYAQFTLGARSGAGSDSILGLTAGATIVPYTGLAYGVFGESDPTAGKYKPITTGTIGTPNGSTMIIATGDIVRLRRTGSSLFAEVARAASPTSFTVINTWTGVPTTAFYVQMFAANQLAISNPTGLGLV